jgi:hypothetical protein
LDRIDRRLKIFESARDALSFGRVATSDNNVDDVPVLVAEWGSFEVDSNRCVVASSQDQPGRRRRGVRCVLTQSGQQVFSKGLVEKYRKWLVQELHEAVSRQLQEAIVGEGNTRSVDGGLTSDDHDGVIDLTQRSARVSAGFDPRGAGYLSMFDQRSPLPKSKPRISTVHQ